MIVGSLALSTASGQIYNPRAIQDWANAAKNSRADIVMLGDSNQLLGGYGWDAAYIKAINGTIGLYASGLMWCGENNGFGRGMGDGYNIVSPGSNSGFLFTGAPSNLDANARLYDPAAGSEYIYVPENTILSGNRQNGLYINNNINPQNNLTFWVTDGLFETGGHYTPYIRIAQPPWSTVATFSQVDTQGSGIRTTGFNLPANYARTYPIEFRFSPTYYNEGFVGPVFLMYIRVENTGSNGASSHTLYAYGGKSARFMANVLNQSSNEMLVTYFTQIRRLQGENKKILIRIHQGLNDRNETLPSVGNSITPGDSPEAYSDNILSTISRIESIWQSQNWDVSELSYLIVTPFSVSNPQDTELESYKNAAIMIANTYSNICVFDQHQVYTYQEMVDNEYFANSTDRNHLSQAGYNALVNEELAQILLYSCIADYDHNGGVDGGDLSAFFADYEIGSDNADVDNNGGVDGGDLSAFFQAYEDGC